MNCLRLAILFLSGLLLAACGPKSDYALSDAFNAFDMSEIITKAGGRSAGFVDTGTSNAATGIATHIRSGLFAGSPDRFTSYAVFARVREHFAEAHGIDLAQEGWNPEAEEHPPVPCHIVMKYTHQGRYGEFNLWLFPEEDHSRTGFALHYQEKPSQLP